MLAYNVRKGIEQIACNFDRSAQSGYRRLYRESVECGCGGAPVASIVGIAHAHDKMVLVAISQQGICRSHRVEEVDGGARQLYIIYVDEIEVLATVK